MKLFCSTCHSPVSVDQLNVEQQAAFCLSCNRRFAISAVAESSLAGKGAGQDPDRTQLPDGITYETQPDGMRLSVRTRDAFGWTHLLVPCGVCGVFIGICLLRVIAEGRCDLFTGLVAFFGLFVLLGCLDGILDHLFGGVFLTIRGVEGEIFTRYFHGGYRHSFRLDEVRRCHEDVYSEKTEDGEEHKFFLVIAERTEYRFGSNLTSDQRKFFAKTLENWVARYKTSMASKARCQPAPAPMLQ